MFNIIKKKVADRLALLSNYQLLQVDLERNDLFTAYLDCFIDPVERQLHNCNCCKNFLRNYGGIIAIVDGAKIETLWDFTLEDELYSQVPITLGKIVREAAISGIFLSNEKELGTDFNYQVLSHYSLLSGSISMQYFRKIRFFTAL